MIKKFFAGFLAAAGLLLAVGCTAPAPQGDPQLPTVYGSIHSVTEFTRYIAGDKMNVSGFLPAGGDPHSFEPSAEDMRKVQGAKAFFYDGLGAESYLFNLESNTPGVPFVRVAPVGDLIHNENAHSHGEDEDHSAHDHSSHAHGDHEHSQEDDRQLSEPTDPHIWISPKRAEAEMANIAAALSDLDAGNAAVYQDNLARQQEKIAQLDRDFQKLSGQTFVVTHNAFGYLGKDYNLTFRGVSVDSHDEPSPTQIKELVDYCKANQIRVIYRGVNEDEKLAKTVAAEAGLEIRTLDNFESDSGQDYYAVMQANYRALAGE